VTVDSAGVSHVHFVRVNDGVKIKTAPPNHQQATTFANLYPTLIGSKAAVDLRDKMFPELAKGGTVKAFALGSSQAANGRLRPSPLPIDVIQVQAHNPRKAIDLASKATIAFQRYVAERADRNGSKDSPIVLRILTLPTKAENLSSSKSTLAGLVGALVLGGFVLLTMILERLFPLRRAVLDGGPGALPDLAQREGDPLLQAELERLQGHGAHRAR
jgi:hypothetical protein